MKLSLHRQHKQWLELTLYKFLLDIGLSALSHDSIARADSFTIYAGS